MMFCEVESVAEEKVDFSKFVDKERSYPINNVDSWDRIAFLFDENIQSIIGDFGIGHSSTKLFVYCSKTQPADGEIVMCGQRKCHRFPETISEKDAAICAKKGWHPFECLQWNLKTEGGNRYGHMYPRIREKSALLYEQLVYDELKNYQMIISFFILCSG